VRGRYEHYDRTGDSFLAAECADDKSGPQKSSLTSADPMIGLFQQ
jgi:hypothetical protein